MLDNEQCKKAYERGLAWANETFDLWLRTGRSVPTTLPLTERDARSLFDAAAYPDVMTRTRMVMLAFDAACLRWSRLVSLVATPAAIHEETSFFPGAA